MEEAEAIRRVAGALLTGGGAIGVGIGVGLSFDTLDKFI